MYKNAIPADYLSRQRDEFEVRDRTRNESTEIQKGLSFRIEKLERELVEARQRYLRLAADLDHHRKRTARELDPRAATEKEEELAPPSWEGSPVESRSKSFSVREPLLVAN